MRRGTHRNRAFDIMGDRFGALIDPNHFGGKSSFSIRRKNALHSKEANSEDSKPVPVNKLTRDKQYSEGVLKVEA